MNGFELIILLVFIVGLGIILYIILRDPVLMLKTFLRALKAYDLEIRLVLLPVWGIIWLFDKAFSLKIYISGLEEASKPKKHCV